MKIKASVNITGLYKNLAEAYNNFADQMNVITIIDDADVPQCEKEIVGFIKTAMMVIGKDLSALYGLLSCLKEMESLNFTPQKELCEVQKHQLN